MSESDKTRAITVFVECDGKSVKQVTSKLFSGTFFWQDARREELPRLL